MSKLNLQDALSAIDIQADWVGLREVKESTTYRIIRDGNPQANSRGADHGVIHNFSKLFFKCEEYSH